MVRSFGSLGFVFVGKEWELLCFTNASISVTKSIARKSVWSADSNLWRSSCSLCKISGVFILRDVCCWCLLVPTSHALYLFLLCEVLCVNSVLLQTTLWRLLLVDQMWYCLDQMSLLSIRSFNMSSSCTESELFSSVRCIWWDSALINCASAKSCRSNVRAIICSSRVMSNRSQYSAAVVICFMLIFNGTSGSWPHNTAGSSTSIA